jgi:hypothetical protein
LHELEAEQLRLRVDDVVEERERQRRFEVGGARVVQRTRLNLLQAPQVARRTLNERRVGVRGRALREAGSERVKPNFAAAASNRT